MPPGAEPLDLFLLDGPARIARLAAPALEAAVPGEYRAAARSVARQAGGGWTVALMDGDGFSMRPAMRELLFAPGFGTQCGRVLDTVLGARCPELVAGLARVGNVAVRRGAVMSAFFHYFAAHEFLHIEQGLGSDQYKDSDAYMPIVMEADHVADVAGLVLAAAAGIPELSALAPRDVVLLLTAIHLASMHSFAPGDGSGLDAYAFSRLLVWHLHFARFTKAADRPDFSSPAVSRAWTVTLPRLVGRADQRIALPLLERRRRRPLPAGSDVVLAYHHEDGIYRIHRAALTDGDRVLRLARAIVEARFDDVRLELEELLVNNPALVPQARLAPDIEWAAGAVIDELDRLGSAAGMDAAALAERVGAARAAYDRLRSSARGTAGPARALTDLLDRGDLLLDGLEGIADPGDARLPRLRRLALSVVDQIVLTAA